MKNQQALPWLLPGRSFPPVIEAWGIDSDAPGLLALGGELSVDTLIDAYRKGIFPWFSEGQPILWWSPDPRMVMKVEEFKLHRSFKKKLAQFSVSDSGGIRVDTAFRQVIESCASASRQGQSGTWILPEMVEAYVHLHQAGVAHSIETWIDGELAGGLYCVAMGKAVFGESMFTQVPDASKIALAALVAICRLNSIEQIDCQQNTKHLASLGAREMSRAEFLQCVDRAKTMPSIEWKFRPVYWNYLLQSTEERRDGP
jgi:leucyl/phenylalanyl-tRNA--protein transferase